MSWSPQVNMSAAAYPSSGQVCMDMWDSAMGQDASYALRRELVKSFPNYVCAHLLGGSFSNSWRIYCRSFKSWGSQISEFQQHVRT